MAAKPNLADVSRFRRSGASGPPVSRQRAEASAPRSRGAACAGRAPPPSLGGRAASVSPGRAPNPFPLAEGVFQAVAGRLGYRVGIKKARALRGRLEKTGVLESGGSYRQPYRNQAGGSGFRVRLYRLGVDVRRSAALSRKRLSAGFGASSPRVRVRWWKHPLFGDYEGRPPPQWTKGRCQKTASLDEYEAGVRLRPDCKSWARPR